jgi:hypothetical protein
VELGRMCNREEEEYIKSNLFESVSSKNLGKFIYTPKGDFFGFFFNVRYSTLLHLPPLRFHCASEDAGIEPRTVAT